MTTVSELSGVRRPRADAVRSRAAVLTAAIEVLSTRPDASLGEVARAAGVARQTVYAHFPSRGDLLAAVVEELTREAVEAMEAARLDEGPARDALKRFLDVGSEITRRGGAALEVAAGAVADDAAAHAPVVDHLVALARRGQEAGEFDDALAPEWVAAATIALGHAAAEEAWAGRITQAEADRALRTSVLRVFGAVDEA